MSYKWEVLLRLHQGHTIWVDQLTKKPAIRDPDDGILWIRKDLPVEFHENVATVHLYTERGDKTRTLMTHANAYKLCEKLGLNWTLTEEFRATAELYRKLLGV